MSNQEAAASAAQAGSATNELIQKGPDAGGSSAGESSKNTEEMIPKSQYLELEKKIGTQGAELGEYRNFFNEISPLLEKLDKDPELTKAILEDKISPELIKAVSEGTISLKDAETVSRAESEVRKEMGDKAFQNASPEEVASNIEKKVNQIVKGAEDKITKITSKAEELADFKSSIKEFIASHDDYADFAEDINVWLKKHPNIYDIEVAYHAVKGVVLDKKFKEDQEAKAAEAAKDVAANISGGGSQNSASLNNDDLVDKLFSRRANPNIF